jgi:hypothetical protein
VVKKGTKRPRKRARSDRFPLIEMELQKRTKAELVEMILAIAKEHAIVARELEDRLTIEKPVDLLVADVSSAIDRATDFDERMMNRNFDVDWQAYADVQKGLSRLVELGHLAVAKSLALKLMKGGSYQVECSDEGFMTERTDRSTSAAKTSAGRVESSLSRYSSSAGANGSASSFCASSSSAVASETSP